MSIENDASEVGFSYLKIAAIGSGFFGLTLVWSVYNTYMPLLLGNFIESKALRGSIMGLDNLLAVLLIPVIGAWSDRVRHPLGQRLPFIAVGMPVAALLFALLPFNQTSLVLLLALDIVFLLAMTLYRAPVIALMPDHTPEEKRSTANGIINLMGGIGGLIAFFALAPLYDLDTSYPFVLGAALLLLAFFFLFTVTDRHPPYTTPISEGEEASTFSKLFSDIGSLRAPEYRRARFILLAIFLYSLGFGGLEAQFSTYATETLLLSGGQAGLLLGFFSLAFVVMALPAGLIGSRIGKAPAMLLGLGTLSVLFVLMFMFQLPAALRIFLILAGLSWALVNVQAYPLVADLGDKTHIGFFTGMYYLFSMSASIIAPALMGLGMDVFGGSSLFILAGLAMLGGCISLGKARS